MHPVNSVDNAYVIYVRLETFQMTATVTTMATAWTSSEVTISTSHTMPQTATMTSLPSYPFHSYPRYLAAAWPLQL